MQQEWQVHNDDKNDDKSCDNNTGLILSGGGARAAYQVGVLKAIAEILPARLRNPFSIICGTSAGAINAAALASNAHRFRLAVRGLERSEEHTSELTSLMRTSY